ncbi:MAG: bifunctional DNA-formamidopyrimidine glycosylase/DNA-(apurinic or apyrimidinic site) lyase [Pontiellaceae bacterium]|jgi:formamidopyrimidine-DNA glycosylase|nr:bifunctional DNA-formamidopyrimidine glycosylase/DNA-(apurinic or apyrimidinic site) lyase [Pontiellaceae bacterium]
MPELPEVETIRRQLLAAGVEGRIIEKAYVEWPRTVEPLTPSVFCQAVRGRTLEKINRHGKWLVFCLDGNENLLVHLRMTGGFYLTQGTFRKGPHDRAIFEFSGGLNLHFRDPRKFGRFRLESCGGFRSVETVSGGDGAPPSRVSGLGPDALTVTKKEFFQALEGKDKILKALLLDQSVVAGIGNIYADEALFEAKLDPRRRSGTLSSDEISRLWKAIRRVIEAGVRNGGTSLGNGQGNYVDLNGEAGGHREKVKVYGRAGQPCVVCKQPLHRIRIAQRTTVFCPGCQR